MFSKKTIKIAQLTFAITAISSLASAQTYLDDYLKTNTPKENSPFSRLGIGSYLQQNTVASASFGGLTAAFQDASLLNPNNPASYASLRTTAFEVGINAKKTTITQGSKTANTWSGNLNYFAIGFPTHSVINEELDKKTRNVRWGMAFSLRPYTQIGYLLKTVEAHPKFDTAQIVTNYVGTGSTYKLMWGNAFTTKNFSMGLNLGYFFGNLGNYRGVGFTGFDPYYYDVSIRDSRVSGFVWDIGAQYKMVVEKPKVDELAKKHIIFGIAGNAATNYDISTNDYFRRIGSVALDTLINIEDQRTKGKLPSEWTFGAMYEVAHQGNPTAKKLRIGVDYKITIAPDATFENASKLAVGIEYLPEATNYKNYLTRIRYRAGFQSYTDPRVWKGVQLGGWNVSGGFGFPIVLPREQSYAFLHIGVEYGRLAAGSIIGENYTRFNVGFTFNDNSWFLKRKFN